MIFLGGNDLDHSIDLDLSKKSVIFYSSDLEKAPVIHWLVLDLEDLC